MGGNNPLLLWFLAVRVGCGIFSFEAEFDPSQHLTYEDIAVDNKK